RPHRDQGDPLMATPTRTRTRAGARRGRSRVPVVGIVIAAVVALAVVALAVTLLTGDDQAAETVEVADVDVEGEALPQLPGDGSDPAIGSPVPSLHGV